MRNKRVKSRCSMSLTGVRAKSEISCYNFFPKNRSREQFFFPKNRRGTHIEVVLSFIIFMIFLGFLFSIMKPMTVEKDKESILNYLETALVEKFSANLTSATIKLPENKNCFEINSIINFAGLSVIVKDENNTPVRINLTEGQYLRIDGTPDKRTFKIYYSEEKFEEFPLNGTGCTFGAGTGYYSEAGIYGNETMKKIGLVRTEKYVFKTKIIDVLGNDTKYEELKSEMKIPPGNDFSFSFRYSGGAVIGAEGNITSRIEVYSKDVPVQYIDDEANIKYGVINIKIW